MRILAILPDDGRRHLEQAVAPACQLLPDQSDAAVLQALKQRGCDALVLDPTQLAEDAWVRLLSVIQSTAVPVVVYAPLSAVGVRRVLQVGELGPHELILRGIDDDLELIRRKVASLIVPSVSSVLFSKAAKRLRRFPDRLQAASVELFGGGPLPRWVDEFAANAGLGRRTVDRWMHRSGINGAAMLLDVARLARTWEPLAEHKARPADVAQALGYSRLRLLVSHTRRIIGVGPSDLGRGVSREEFAARLGAAVLRR